MASEFAAGATASDAAPETIEARRDAIARRRLEARIARRYEIGRVEIEAAGRRFVIAKVKEPDTVFHEAMYDESHQPDVPLAWQPYWAQAWESAVVLAGWAAESQPAGRRWLDLGCGVGVVGAVTAAFGADTVLGDIAQPGLLFSQLNVWPWRERALVRRIDWQRDRLTPKFDRIACADIVYDRRDWDDLDRFWRAHLNVDGEVIVAEPSRITGREFREAIVEKGWNLIPAGVRRIGRREVIITRLKPRG